MGIQSGTRAIMIKAPDEAVAAIELPDINYSDELKGSFDYIHLFVTKQTEFKEHFPKLKAHLGLQGMLWVSWPKNKQLDTDLSIKKVIEMGYEFGLVESTCLSINRIWSALKFTHPKEGKVYNNSYGKLNL
ncbi:hypothetical protein [Dyadobacter sp. NIV53]|uniref:hypothetical protein n=1 Tax=Dyadobacter sp. NIV53 TaxID=2861765 RepID=UPI001C88153F|nr:hypothetical protein [Dyadobacter sp. NIV53]